MTKPILLSVLLCLSWACGGAGETTTSQSTTTPTTASTTVATGSTTTPAAPTTTSGGEMSEDCLVGDWALDVDSFAAAMETAMGASGGDVTVSVTAGSGSLQFAADGAASGDYDGLTIEMDLGTEGMPPIEMVLSGEVVGSWTVEEDTLILTPGEGTSLDFEASVGGEPFPMPFEPETVSFGASRSTISCEGDELIVQPEVEDAPGTVWLRA